MQVDTEHDNVPVQVSIPVLVIAIAISVLVSSSMTFILGLLCGVKYMEKRLQKTIFKQSFPIPEEKIKGSTKGPVYEEVELEDKKTTIVLSKNIAYEQVKK